MWIETIQIWLVHQYEIVLQNLCISDINSEIDFFSMAEVALNIYATADNFILIQNRFWLDDTR